MGTDLTDHCFLIVKGYIDAKDERQRKLHGSFLGVVSRRSTKYLSVMLSRDVILNKKSWDELLALHKEKSASEERDPSIIRSEEELYQYIDISRVLNTVAKNHNTKQAEQAISRFCTEQLRLKAVSFIDFIEATESELKRFDVPNTEAEKDTPPVVDDVQAETVGEEPAGKEAKNESSLFLRCEPILDPVHGMAMSELSVGDYVCARLAADSVFYRLLAKNIPNFNGVVTAQVSGILINDLGTATVSLSLSEGISGVMKLSGKVRIQTADVEIATKAPRFRRRLSLDAPSPQVVLTVAGLVVLFSAIALIFYILL